jgi:DNA-binding response OmpR family regulator
MSRPAVLFASEDADSADMYAVGLSLAGFRPVIVADASSLRSSLTAQVPQAIVVDVTAGWRTGWDLLAELRRRVDTRHTPVVLLADGREDSIRVRAEASRCAALLTKPCLPDTLASAVRDALETTPTTMADARNLFRHQ